MVEVKNCRRTPESWHGDPSYLAKKAAQIKAAHDWAEAETARAFGLPDFVSDRVKLCDGIDCLLWCKLHAPHVMGGDG
ncbi:MAG: hypothetical protein U5N55_01690 [Cypionkella sp.]|nr:hypothetical protein [Cypionkella sp.]